MKGGRRYEVRSTVRTPADGPLVLSEGNPVTLEAGPDWIPLEGAVWMGRMESGTSSAIGFRDLSVADLPAVLAALENLRPVEGKSHAEGAE